MLLLLSRVDVSVGNDTPQNPLPPSVRPPTVALAVAPDGEAVVSVSQAGLTPERLRTGIVNPHALSFSPDGRSLLVCGGEPGQRGVVELFDWPPEGPAAVPRMIRQVGEDSLYAAAWSPGGDAIAVAGLDGFGRVLEVATGQERLRLSGHSRGLTGIAFLAPERLVTSSLDGSLRVWDAATGRQLRTLANHTGPVTGLCLGPLREPARLRMVASFGDDRTVRLWQPEIGRLVRFVRLPSKPLAVAWLSRNRIAAEHGGMLAVACLDGQVRLIAVDTVAIPAEQPVLDGPAFCIAARSEENVLIVAGQRGQIRSVHLADLLRDATSGN